MKSSSSLLQGSQLWRQASSILPVNKYSWTRCWPNKMGFKRNQRTKAFAIYQFCHRELTSRVMIKFQDRRNRCHVFLLLTKFIWCELRLIAKTRNQTPLINEMQLEIIIWSTFRMNESIRLKWMKLVLQYCSMKFCRC